MDEFNQVIDKWYEDMSGVNRPGLTEIQQAEDEVQWWKGLARHLLVINVQPGYEHPWRRMKQNEEGWTKTEWLQYSLDELEVAEEWYFSIRGEVEGDPCPECEGTLKMYGDFGPGCGELACEACGYGS